MIGKEVNTMDDKKVMWTGGIGAVIAAICCVTPVLVIALGAVGLTALVAYLDYVLLPALAVCLAVVGYGFYMGRQRQAACGDRDVVHKPGAGT
jgi:mercuric ion transport protein